jgi:hypothetical protein
MLRIGRLPAGASGECGRRRRCESRLDPSRLVSSATYHRARQGGPQRAGLAALSTLPAGAGANPLPSLGSRRPERSSQCSDGGIEVYDSEE